MGELTEEEVAALVASLRSGFCLDRAAQAVGISIGRLYEWMQEPRNVAVIVNARSVHRQTLAAFGSGVRH